MHGASRKVRRVAEASGLGRLRHVESTTLNTPAWATVVALVLVFSFGSWSLGNSGLGEAFIVFAIWIVLAGAAVVFLGAEKLLVLDRGIVVGSFAPFLTPTVLPFAGIDARTVSAVVGTQRTVGLLLADRGVNGASRTVLWSRHALTFIGVSPTVARRAALRGEPADLANAAGSELWVFSVRNPRRLDPLVRALAAAMQDAGAPGADGVVAHALPPRRLRASVDDADHLGIPEHFRREPLRRR